MGFTAIGLAVCVAHASSDLAVVLAAVCALGLACWAVPPLLAPAGGRAALLPVRYDNRLGAFGMLGVFPGFVVWACICAVTVMATALVIARTDLAGEWWFAVCAGAALLVSMRLTCAYRAPAASALRALRGRC